MDQSLFAVLNDAVAADATRLSGRRFADARGAGIARRVRTRRTVRAVGAGGASAVAVGALALGATQLPWGGTASPGLGATDCVTPTPTADTYTYWVVVSQGETPVETVSLTDAATGAAVLTAIAQPDGTYEFADAHGNPLEATLEPSGSYRFITPQLLTQNVSEAPAGAAAIMIESISTTDAVRDHSTSPSPSDNCYTPSPTPSSSATASASASASAEPSPSSDPSPSPSPRGTPTEVSGVQFADVNGRWCPTSPPAWGEPCVTVALPQVVYDDFPAEPEYVRLEGFADSIDPTVLGIADYALPPDTGGCWTGYVDGYPSMSGAALVYCPASALAGRAEIDDPTVAAEGWLSPGEAVPDYRGRDRLYITQEVTPYPMVRADP